MMMMSRGGSKSAMMMLMASPLHSRCKKRAVPSRRVYKRPRCARACVRASRLVYERNDEDASFLGRRRQWG
jgi:hypothetical protein